MSPVEELAQMVIARLRGDAAVSGLVGQRVYDVAPPTASFPYISIGSDDFQPDDAEGIHGIAVTLNIDAWSRDAGRLGPARRLCGAIYAALHEADAELATYGLAGLTVEAVRAFRDADGITAHGVVTITAAIET